MRIAIVHSYYSQATPSGENAVVDAQADALRSAGHSVKVISRETDVVSKQPLYALRSALTVSTGVGASPVAQLRTFRPDVVHVHNLFPNFGTQWLSSYSDAPIICTVHNYRSLCAVATLYRDGHPCSECPEKGSRNAIRHACYRGSKLATAPLAIRTRGGIARDALLRRSDRVVLLSEKSLGIMSTYGLETDKIRLIPNFVDKIESARPRDDYWLFSGRLTPEKGLLELLDVWPHGQRLMIAGDGPLASEVWHRAAQSDSIKPLGLLKRTELDNLLTNARGALIPSRCAEGAYPLTYLEALASGTPSIAFSANGAADDIREHQTGIALESWNELHTAMQNVNENFDQFSSAARHRYSSAFSVDVWVRSVEALYNEVTP